MEASSDYSEPSSLLSNALQLALRLVDYSMKTTEDSSGEGNSVSCRSLQEISLDQVSWHDHYEDCWIILYDRVYDITEFLREHPGGVDVLLEYAGRDATLAYRGFGHSAQAWQILQKYLIGVLPEKERTGIFKEEMPLGRNLRLKAASS